MDAMLRPQQRDGGDAETGAAKCRRRRRGFQLQFRVRLPLIRALLPLLWCRLERSRRPSSPWRRLADALVLRWTPYERTARRADALTRAPALSPGRRLPDSSITMALLALKTGERKVKVDKDLQSMQLLSTKKGSDEVFIKLGSDKDKKKESAERDERAKKSLSINEFLKPAEGERYYGGRGRGRGRGERGSFRGGYGGGYQRGPAAAPSIEDQAQFPTLGGR